MYISGGFNVYPAEVEQALMRIEGVADVAVVGVPDERMGEVGKAYVVRVDRHGPAIGEDDVIGIAKQSAGELQGAAATSSSSTRSPATCPARCSRRSCEATDGS